MRIQSNIPALNVWRHWDNHNQSAAKALQHITTGQRILSAADDAAGLSIAQRMKAQLRMNSVEQQNADSMKSVYEAADAMLGQAQGIFSRMLELSAQAANGTYAGPERKNMDREYQQLLDEVNRILPATEVRDSLFGQMRDPGKASGALKPPDFSFQVDNVGEYMDGLNGFLDQVNLAVKNGDKEKALELGIDLDDGLSNSQRLKNAVIQYTKDNGGRFSGGGNFTISVSDGDISVSTGGGDAEDYGLSGTNLITQDSAEAAMAAVQNAMDKVSSRRSNLGAMANMMEYTKNRMGQMEENLTDALSRLTDADMAKELIKYTHEQLLSQVSSFLMAKTIHEPEMVLKMLRNES